MNWHDPKTLAQIFAAGAAARPDAALIVASDVRPAKLSLAEVHDLGSVAANGLRAAGISPGDVVAVQLPAWSEWLVATVAVARAGAVLLPIVSVYGARELSFILRQSRAKLLITPDRFRKGDFAEIVRDCGTLPHLRHHVVIGNGIAAGAMQWDALFSDRTPTAPAPRHPDDLAMLVYTSGTTADPKGVMHSNRTLAAEMETMAWHRRAVVRETVLSPWPPGHVAGASTLMRFLRGGTELVLMDQWDASMAARLIECERVTSISLTPFHLHGILDAADAEDRDLSSLAHCLVGAAPVPGTLIARAEARGLHTYRSYGSSEHPTVTSGNPDDPMDKRLTTEGRPMPGNELRFVDEAGEEVPSGAEGELAVRGPERFGGYLDNALDAAAFLPGGWFLTGDIGRVDAEGYLLITDRKKDVIIRGGENISSREVEELLFGHPDIVEAAVVAAPHPTLGEIVLAYVVARPGAVVTQQAVAAHLAAAGIARIKIPEQLIVVDDFPRNATGKVLKHELRRAARDEAK